MFDSILCCWRSNRSFYRDRKAKRQKTMKKINLDSALKGLAVLVLCSIAGAAFRFIVNDAKKREKEVG